jgi:hypothetical protein
VVLWGGGSHAGFHGAKFDECLREELTLANSTELASHYLSL